MKCASLLFLLVFIFIFFRVDEHVCTAGWSASSLNGAGKGTPGLSTCFLLSPGDPAYSPVVYAVSNILH